MVTPREMKVSSSNQNNGLAGCFQHTVVVAVGEVKTKLRHSLHFDIQALSAVV